MSTHLAVDLPVSAQSNLQAWYLGELRPKLALAVRRQDIDVARAAALDQLMQELLDVRRQAI
jgi:hypothetical protein